MVKVLEKNYIHSHCSLLGGCMIQCLDNHVTMLISSRGMHFKVNMMQNMIVPDAIFGLKY